MDILTQRLREIRTERNLRQEDVAEAIGIARATYSSYERGVTPPSDTLASVAAFHGVTADWLLGLSDEKTPGLSDKEPELDEELVTRLCQLTPYQVQRVRDYMQGLIDSRQRR